MSSDKAFNRLSHFVSLVQLCVFSHLVFLEPRWDFFDLRRLQLDDASEKRKHRLGNDLIVANKQRHDQTQFNNYYFKQSVRANTSLYRHAVMNNSSEEALNKYSVTVRYA